MSIRGGTTGTLTLPLAGSECSKIGKIEHVHLVPVISTGRYNCPTDLKLCIQVFFFHALAVCPSVRPTVSKAIWKKYIYRLLFKK